MPRPYLIDKNIEEMHILNIYKYEEMHISDA